MKRQRSTAPYRANTPRVGLYVYAVGVCASAFALQSLPSAAAPSFLSDPLDALYRRWGGRDSPSSALPDLNVHNLSVHRVRYINSPSKDDQAGRHHRQQEEEEQEEAQDGECPLPTLSESPSIWTAALPDETAGVVVTWDDLPVAAATRDSSYSDDAGEGTKNKEKTTWFPSYSRAKQQQPEDKRPSSNVEVTYELQVWVHGWGLDALWHQANRRIRTREPFAVLTDLPPELELRFRVRARVVTRWARGWLVDSETAGPWSSPPVALAPSSQHALAAVAAFLVNNKAFFALLAGCIGGGALVLAQLYWRRRMYRKSRRRQGTQQRFHSASSCSSSDGTSLEQEVRDLRQELADSEAEVRRLMLFRGFGVDALTADELDTLARELKQTLRTVRKLQAAASQDAKAVPMSDSETEEADADSERQETSVEPSRAQADAAETGSKGGRLAGALAAAFPLLRGAAPVSAAAS